MMPLSSAPPEDKNTVSRVDNSKSGNFFHFLDTVALSSAASPSSSTTLPFGFSLFDLKRKSVEYTLFLVL